jgi:hypothetical protein
MGSANCTPADAMNEPPAASTPQGDQEEITVPHQEVLDEEYQHNPVQIHREPYDTRWSCGECFFTLFSVLFFKCMAPECFRTYTPLELKEFYAIHDLQTQYNPDVEHKRIEEQLGLYIQEDQLRAEARMPIATSWVDIRPNLQTGDLVFFRCTDSYGSFLVTRFTGEFTHIGVVIVRRTGPREKFILLFESVSEEDDLVDYETGTTKAGVRQVDLENRLNSSESHYFAVMKLRYPSKECQEIVQKRIEDFAKKEARKSYNHSKLDLCRVACDCGMIGHNKNSSKAYFCSQLVCKALQVAGVLDSEGVNPAKTDPNDYFQHDLPFINGIGVDAIYYMPPLHHPSSQDNRRRRRKQAQQQDAWVAAPIQPGRMKSL